MSRYSKLRERELKHIASVIKDDKKYGRLITALYRRASNDIRRTIEADIEGFAYRDKVSMAEAKEIISKTDVASYQAEAKRIVEDAARRRKAGHKVTYADYTDKVNRELRHYNITMRSNRLDLLQARINLVTTDLASKEEGMLSEKLFQEATKEMRRQAGILGSTVPTQGQMYDFFRSTILSDVSGITFSDRIWTNQAELRNNVNIAIQRGLIRGENPRMTARELRQYVNSEFFGKYGNGGARFVADRLAVTEMARAQSLSQKHSFERNGITKYIFISEADERTCEECWALDGKVMDVADMESFENAPPIHSLCRCSLSAYVD